MDSHELMRLLIPDAKVRDLSEFTGLTTSLLYMERREAGKQLHQTGTRNTIDRLDLFCEWNLSRNPDLVRIVGERYLNMHRRHISPVNGKVTVEALLTQLGVVARECGEAQAALSGQCSLKQCTVEVAQAKAALEAALELVTAMEEQNA
jgi:hypothetical protein